MLRTVLSPLSQSAEPSLFGPAVPIDVEHTLIWTKVPIYHPNLVHETIAARIEQDGLWGFSGIDSPPPSPSKLPSCLPALEEWGITMDKLIRSAPPSLEEADLVEKAGSEVHRYVKNRWTETQWETAWFVNPPVRGCFRKSSSIHLLIRFWSIPFTATPKCSRPRPYSCICSAEVCLT